MTLVRNCEQCVIQDSFFKELSIGHLQGRHSSPITCDHPNTRNTDSSRTPATLLVLTESSSNRGRIKYAIYIRRLSKALHLHWKNHFVCFAVRIILCWMYEIKRIKVYLFPFLFWPNIYSCFPYNHLVTIRMQSQDFDFVLESSQWLWRYFLLRLDRPCCGCTFSELGARNPLDI